jgi:hypothetical protein
MFRLSSTADARGLCEDVLLLAASAAYVVGFVAALQAALGRLLY